MLPATPAMQGRAFGAFPTAGMVHAAAALFPRERHPDQTVALGWVDGDGGQATYADFGPSGRSVELRAVRSMVEGPRWRVEVGPGLVAFASTDYARRWRAAEREVQDRAGRVQLLAAMREAGEPFPDETGGVSRIRSWSSKSRARMVRRLGEFDYSVFFEGGAVPAMVTLTYPGDWLTVVPSASVARRHVDRLRKRFEREWGRPLVAIWKREFQERGAPHYHLLMCPPAGVLEATGETFPQWLSRTWAEIVAHPDAWERWKHRQAGTGVDYAEGARALDPVRLGVYFAKHGTFADKEYQNEAPREWLHDPACEAYVTGSGCEGCADEGVGRFWGYWRLKRCVVGVEVAPDVAQLLVRTARRWSSANRYYVRRKVWRKKYKLDPATGEVLGWRWVRRSVKVPVRRLRGRAGYLMVNDGPGFASQLAGVTAALVPRPRGGPAGFLP